MVCIERVEQIVERHGARKDRVIEILLDCQDEFRYLPKELIEYVAGRIGVSVGSVLSVATFYRGFSLKPVGRYPVSVCTGTACQVLGAPKLIEAFERELGVKKGDTTEDGTFSLHTINCPGCCGLAMVVVVGHDVHGKVTQAAVPRLVKKYREKASREEA